MTEATPLPTPAPAPALQAVFDGVWQHQMRGVPMVNPALRVEAVGFRPWNGHWLGVLITPWFMNLVLMPRLAAQWQPIGERESRHYVFPAGVFEFIGGRDAALGDYQACSLFSPMFDFADHQGAHATAVAALQALFDAGQRPAATLAATAAPPPTALPSVPAPPPSPAGAGAPAGVSKRAFLLGLPARAGRES